MNIIENWKNFVKKMEGMKRQELKAYKMALMVLIVGDLLGLYWYLGMKTLGASLLIVLILLLAFIFYFERDLPEEPRKPVESQKIERGGRKENG